MNRWSTPGGKLQMVCAGSKTGSEYHAYALASEFSGPVRSDWPKVICMRAVRGLKGAPPTETLVCFQMRGLHPVV